MRKAPKNSNGSRPRRSVNVIFVVKGVDAKRLLDYEEREKLRTHAQAVYKLAFERLDQLDKAAGNVSENA